MSQPVEKPSFIRCKVCKVYPIISRTVCYRCFAFICTSCADIWPDERTGSGTAVLCSDCGWRISPLTVVWIAWIKPDSYVKAVASTIALYVWVCYSITGSPMDSALFVGLLMATSFHAPWNKYPAGVDSDDAKRQYRDQLLFPCVNCKKTRVLNVWNRDFYCIAEDNGSAEYTFDDITCPACGATVEYHARVEPPLSGTH